MCYSRSVFWLLDRPYITTSTENECIEYCIRKHEFFAYTETQSDVSMKSGQNQGFLPAYFKHLRYWQLKLKKKMYKIQIILYKAVSQDKAYRSFNMDV